MMAAPTIVCQWLLEDWKLGQRYKCGAEASHFHPRTLLHFCSEHAAAHPLTGELKNLATIFGSAVDALGGGRCGLSMKPQDTTHSPAPRRGAIADQPHDEDRAAVLEEFFAQTNTTRAERREAAEAGALALARLCDVMRQKTGQGYHVRAMLYSLWNGQPTSLLELVALDWAIQKDLCAVFLGFGFEESKMVDGKREWGVRFFYDAIKDAVTAAGLWEWFLEAETESEVAK